MQDDYGVTVNATKAQIEDFKESVLWTDICRELDFWVEGFNREADSIVDRVKAENLSTAATLTWIGNLDGRKRTVEYVKQILDVFLNIIEEREKEANNE